MNVNKTSWEKGRDCVCIVTKMGDVVVEANGNHAIAIIYYKNSPYFSNLPGQGQRKKRYRSVY